MERLRVRGRLPRPRGGGGPDRDAAVVVYGASGATREAHVAALKLARLGFARVRVLEGGVAAWAASGYPLEGEAPDEVGPGRAPFQPDDGTDEIDSQRSSFAWTGRNRNGKHGGTANVARGEAAVRGGIVAGAFDVDLRTLESTDIADPDLRKVLIDHLLSDDSFFAERHPIVRVAIERGVPRPGATECTQNYHLASSASARKAST